MRISYEEFEKVDLRSGTITKVEPFPRAKKPAYKVWVDFGTEIGIKQTSAQVTVHYTPESLVGRQCNMPHFSTFAIKTILYSIQFNDC